MDFLLIWLVGIPISWVIFLFLFGLLNGAERFVVVGFAEWLLIGFLLLMGALIWPATPLLGLVRGAPALGEYMRERWLKRR
jgi:uncharacterized membrane protein